MAFEQVYSWGLNQDGLTLSNQGGSERQSTPQLISGLSGVSSIFGGASHTVALLSNGDVVSYGANEYGECGLGHNQEFVNHPSKLQSNNIAMVATSNNSRHTLLLDKQGLVYSFGTGDFGQLGHGDLKDSDSPKLVSALKDVKIVSIAAGGNGSDGYSLAISDAGELYTWGSNEFGKNHYLFNVLQCITGQLGLDDCDKRILPTKVDALTRVKLVAAGSNHTIALRANGQLFSFGRNDYGQLGHNDVEHKYSAEEIKTLKNKNIVDIKAGGEYSLALSDDGSLYVWGSSDEGQLGMSDKRQRDVPTLFDSLPEEKFLKVAAGWFHVIALTKSGKVYTWGRNDDHQLGFGELDDPIVRTPKEVTFLTDKHVGDVSVGCFCSFALCGKEEQISNEPGMDLDDLVAWGELRSAGKITEEKFQLIKKQILGL
ncbi:ultraviolet-B receptor UVR8 [Acrasis kona]|uniref:Ultraviolet-B receptor UVR8 n=1 Tax=Acrasis kona TaxID=1008807 RepID=A0AAW2ZPE1_9EUKA